MAARLRTPLGADRHRHRPRRPADQARRAGRIVRIDGETSPAPARSPSTSSMFWLTPAMDGLFTGPASERRRFLDRLIPCFDPGYRAALGQFERAMQQRNRLLAEDVRDAARFEGFEHIMAETGVAIAAARAAAVAELAAAIGAPRAMPRRQRLPVGRTRPRRHAGNRRSRRGPPSTSRTTTSASLHASASATAQPAARSKARTAPI